jgi:FAD binding domain
MTPQIETRDRDALKSMVRGTVHLPGSDGYHEARQVWNAMIDRRPEATVCAAGVADVMAAVRFAGERGLPVAIRCGGHNVAGTSVGDGSVLQRSKRSTIPRICSASIKTFRLQRGRHLERRSAGKSNVK